MLIDDDDNPSRQVAINPIMNLLDVLRREGLSTLKEHHYEAIMDTYFALADKAVSISSTTEIKSFDLLKQVVEDMTAHKDALGITGVFCGGTEMTPQFHRFAVEELMDGGYFAPTYGNTLMGLAVHKPRGEGDPFDIIYYPPAPRALVEVVDPNDPVRVVGGRYLAPAEPGCSIEIRPESLAEFAFPDGPGWWQAEEVHAMTSVRGDQTQGG